MEDKLCELSQKFVCPKCKGTEFTLDCDGEFRVVGNQVVEVMGVSEGPRTRLACTECDFEGPRIVFGSLLQSGITRERMTEMIQSWTDSAGVHTLCALAQKLMGCEFIYEEAEGKVGMFRIPSNDDKKKQPK